MLLIAEINFWNHIVSKKEHINGGRLFTRDYSKLLLLIVGKYTKNSPM
jgi:hypothetical protein